MCLDGGGGHEATVNMIPEEERKMGKTTKEEWAQKTLVVWLGAMLCCALWGSAFPCVKIGYRLFEIEASDTVAQILFAGCRFTLAGIFTIIFGSVLAGQFLHPTRDALGPVLWLSLLQTVLQYLFFYIGLAHTSGVKASIIGAVNVFVSILVASLLLRQEKLTAQKMAGCAVGFAGVVLINMSGMNLEMSVRGEGFILLSTVAYAFSSAYLKRFSAKYNPVMLSGCQFTVGGLIMVLIGWMAGGRITAVSPQGVLLLLYLALVSAAAYSVWGILLKYNPLSKVAVFGFMNPVFGVLLSALLLGEQATGVTSLISLALVCVGIYVVNSEKR